jgi:hypothetical protein
VRAWQAWRGVARRGLAWQVRAGMAWRLGGSSIENATSHENRNSKGRIGVRPFADERCLVMLVCLPIVRLLQQLSCEQRSPYLYR